jgi:hypothetical protein
MQRSNEDWAKQKELNDGMLRYFGYYQGFIQEQALDEVKIIKSNVSFTVKFSSIEWLARYIQYYKAESILPMHDVFKNIYT